MSGYAVITVKKVYDDIIRLSGRDPSTAALTAAQAASVADQINDRLLEAWEAEYWPDLMLVEQREYRETYSATANYAKDEEVYYGGSYYISLQDGNVGHTPGAAGSSTWWQEYNDNLIRTIDFDQDGETVIGAVDAQQCVFGKDPRVYRGAELIADCSVYNHQILVSAEYAPIQPWVRFRPVCPEFSLTEWASGTAYAIADLCYLASTGQSYKALQSSTNKNPATETDYWEVVGFPKMFRVFVKHAVNADRMKEDTGRARERAFTEEELDRLRDVAFEQTGIRRMASFEFRR